MSHVKLREQYRAMNRLEVAAELRRLAAQLEWHGCLSYGDGAVPIPYELEREIEIDESTDGTALRFEYRLKWPTRD